MKEALGAILFVILVFGTFTAGGLIIGIHHQNKQIHCLVKNGKTNQMCDVYVKCTNRLPPKDLCKYSYKQKMENVK